MSEAKSELELMPHFVYGWQRLTDAERDAVRLAWDGESRLTATDVIKILTVAGIEAQ